MLVGFILESRETFDAAEEEPVDITFVKIFLGYIFNKMKMGGVQRSSAVAIQNFSSRLLLLRWKVLVVFRHFACIDKFINIHNLIIF